MSLSCTCRVTRLGKSRILNFKGLIISIDSSICEREPKRKWQWRRSDLIFFAPPSAVPLETPFSLSAALLPLLTMMLVSLSISVLLFFFLIIIIVIVYALQLVHVSLDLLFFIGGFFCYFRQLCLVRCMFDFIHFPALFFIWRNGGKKDDFYYRIMLRNLVQNILIGCFMFFLDWKSCKGRCSLIWIQI